MAIVLIGVACNATAITVNRGMPVDVPPDWLAKSWVEPTIKHHPQDSDDRLMFLGDIIVLRAPFDAVISFGDLIIAVGLCDVTFHASRKRRRRALPPTNGTTVDPRTIDLSTFAEPTAPAPAAPAVATDRRADGSGAGVGAVADRALERAQHALVVDVAWRGPQRLERNLRRRAVDDGQLVVLARESEHLHGEPAATVVTVAGNDVARAGERADLAATCCSCTAAT